MGVAATDGSRERLAARWPEVALFGSDQKHVVILSSLTLPPLPEAMLSRAAPLLMSREERLLCLLLMLSGPGTSITYITSAPVRERVLDYYFGLSHAIDAAAARRRLTMVSLDDMSPRPLGLKLTEDTDALARIRSSIRDVSRAYLLPFQATDVEERLAVQLGIPMFATSPTLAALGTKSGSRRVFAAAHVACPVGFEDIRTRKDVIEAVRALRAAGHRADEMILKRDDGGGGHYNARLHLADARSDDELAARIEALEPDETSMPPAIFLEQFEKKGGVLEERLVASGLRSPSVQLRASPRGDVEVVSTHDQILAGATGQSYVGCRFPADPRYATAITRQAIEVGRHLADRGVMGHFGVDFVAVPRNDGQWDTYAIEINLRMSGTTVPFLSLQLATGGAYDPHLAAFSLPDGSVRHYVARDELRGDRLTKATVDGLLDAADEAGIAWDPERQVGAIFQCFGGLPASGTAGIIAVATTPSGADELYEHAQHALLSSA
ncbi:MAG TPA: peptide ligase PGM1-related protein [Candidatus Limnocylindria bacterium]